MKFEKYEDLAQHNTETHPGNLLLMGEEDPLQEPLVLTTQGLLQTAARYGNSLPWEPMVGL
jgi:hypothetical protein